MFISSSVLILNMPASAGALPQRLITITRNIIVVAFRQVKIRIPPWPLLRKFYWIEQK
jgi:hypothetical protein